MSGRIMVGDIGVLKMEGIMGMLTRLTRLKVPAPGDLLLSTGRGLVGGTQLYVSLYVGDDDTRLLMHVQGDDVYYFPGKKPYMFFIPSQVHAIPSGVSMSFARMLIYICYGRVKGNRMLNEDWKGEKSS